MSKFTAGTLSGISITGQTGSAEDSMRIGAVRSKAKDEHEKSMYFNAAKRVVFRNCMASCDLTDEQLPNFNANFYYNQVNEQKCLSTCFNTKMNLHFGATTAEKDNLYMNFDLLKSTYQGYEKWHPAARVLKQYEAGHDEEYIAKMTEKLINKTKSASI